eukprot:gene5134-256_t
MIRSLKSPTSFHIKFFTNGRKATEIASQHATELTFSAAVAPQTELCSPNSGGSGSWRWELDCDRQHIGAEDSGFKVEKVYGENYHSWKFQMKMYLFGKDLWELVTEEGALNAAANPEQQRRFRKRENMALVPPQERNSKYGRNKQENGKVNEQTATEIALAVSNTPSDKEDWWIDSGASQHMTAVKIGMFGYTPFKKPIEVKLADDTVIFAHGKGELQLVLYDGKDKVKATLKDGTNKSNVHKNVWQFSSSAGSFLIN